jgi:hypothetical protein
MSNKKKGKTSKRPRRQDADAGGQWMGQEEADDDPKTVPAGQAFQAGAAGVDFAEIDQELQREDADFREILRRIVLPPPTHATSPKESDQASNPKKPQDQQPSGVPEIAPDGVSVLDEELTWPQLHRLWKVVVKRAPVNLVVEATVQLWQSLAKDQAVEDATGDPKTIPAGKALQAGAAGVDFEEVDQEMLRDDANFREIVRRIVLPPPADVTPPKGSDQASTPKKLQDLQPSGGAKIGPEVKPGLDEKQAWSQLQRLGKLLAKRVPVHLVVEATVRLWQTLAKAKPASVKPLSLEEQFKESVFAGLSEDSGKRLVQIAERLDRFREAVREELEAAILSYIGENDPKKLAGRQWSIDAIGGLLTRMGFALEHPDHPGKLLCLSLSVGKSQPQGQIRLYPVGDSKNMIAWSAHLDKFGDVSVTSAVKKIEERPSPFLPSDQRTSQEKGPTDKGR